MTLDAGQAGLLLALAVTLHNAEEMVLLPGSQPYMPKLEIGPLAFRFAAAAIALLFWLAALALLAGLPVRGIVSGFALAMIFNAVVPHLAVTLATRRYHPGTGTAWLLVVPASLAFLAASGGFGAFWKGTIALEALGGLLGLAALLPLLLMTGRSIERRLTRHRH